MENIAFKVGQFSRYVRDTNKNCFDNLIKFYNTTSENISKGYNNEVIIREQTYINEENLQDALLRKSLGSASDPSGAASE